MATSAIARPSSRLLLLLLAPPARPQGGHLAFQPAIEVMHVLQPLAPVRRGVGQQLQAPLGQLAEVAVQAGLVAGQLGPGAGPAAVVVAPVPRTRDPLDEAGRDQEPHGRADRSLAGLEHLGELAEGLLGRVADQQPAEHPAGHAEQALALEAERDLLDILQLGRGGAATFTWSFSRYHTFNID